MKREIKFRAWTITNWNDDDSPIYEMLYPDRLCISGFDLLSESLKDKPRCKYMQFTGFYGKNGEEIYEGDIVRLFGLECDYDNELFKVVFLNGAFQLSHKNGNLAFVSLIKDMLINGIIYKFGYNKLDSNDFLKNHIDVVGNIHQNPELLK